MEDSEQHNAKSQPCSFVFQAICMRGNQMARRRWRKACQQPSIWRGVKAHAGAWLPVQQSSERGLWGSDCTLTTLPSLDGIKA